MAGAGTGAGRMGSGLPGGRMMGGMGGARSGSVSPSPSLSPGFLLPQRSSGGRVSTRANLAGKTRLGMLGQLAAPGRGSPRSLAIVPMVPASPAAFGGGRRSRVPPCVVDTAMRAHPRLPLPSPAPAVVGTLSPPSHLRRVEKDPMPYRMVPPPQQHDRQSQATNGNDKSRFLRGAAAVPELSEASMLAFARSMMQPHPLLLHLPCEGNAFLARRKAAAELMAFAGSGHEVLPSCAPSRRRRMAMPAATSSGRPRRRRRPSARWKGSDTETDEGHDADTTVTESDSDNGRKRGGIGRKGKRGGLVVSDSDSDMEEGDDDDEDGQFGHAVIDERHSLKSFLAYAEWSKALHFGKAASGGSDGGSSAMTGAEGSSSWVPQAWFTRALQRGPPSSPSASASLGFSFSSPLQVEQLEAEFWRIVEDPYLTVETLYGSDLDSGR